MINKYHIKLYDGNKEFAIEGLVEGTTYVECARGLADYYGDERIVMMTITLYPEGPWELTIDGKWVWQGGVPRCTNCGEMPPGYDYGGDVGTTDFCPNCGADMRKRQK